MTTAYNPMFTHRLEPISGFDEITHLQYTAPMDAKALNAPNVSGEEPGLPAGSVVSLNGDGVFKAGAVNNEMPCFLLWNTSDPDGYPSATTANKRYLAGIAGTSAGQDGNLRLDSADLIRNLYEDRQTDDTIGNTNVSVTNATTGGANSFNNLSRAVSTNGSVISYKLRNAVGNFTAWPATCGLELNSTEWDKTILDSDFKTKFAPNTLLTSPAAKAESAVDVSITDLETKFQQMRGGFLTPVTCADFAPVAADKTCADKPSFVNVCGTVSKGIRRNENGVLVLYFWAERTLIPKAITPAATTEGNGTGTGGTENQGTGTGG